MPHSSGGGSHGGGSHGGGSHGGYRSGGSHSGGSTARVSRKPYPGAVRYTYRNRHGVNEYYYVKGRPNKPSLAATIISSFFFSIFFVPFIIMMLATGIQKPRKLDVSSYDSDIVLIDSLQLTEESELRDAMAVFRDKTGVTPGLEILAENDWSAHYASLGDYAYSEYLRLYDDEKHYLIVLSYPEGYAAADFVDWQWEGMMGDDCSRAISSSAENKLTETIQKHLLRSEASNVGSHLADAYREYAKNAMRVTFDASLILISVMFLAFYGLAVYVLIRRYVQDKRISEAVPSFADGTGPAPKQCNCEYCGAMYLSGTVSVCPACGAPVPAENGAGGPC